MGEKVAVMSTQGQGDVADNAAYLREWAADIRKSNGKSVDADRLDSIAAEIDDLKRAARNRDMWKGQCERQADELTRLRTLLSSSRGEQEWRTMDSAPKDGTHIIGNTQWGAREIWWHKEGEYWTDEGDSEPEPTGWIPMPGSVPAGQVPDGYVLVPKAAIRWLLAERDEAISAARTALQSSPQPTAGGDAPTVPNTESFAAISRHLGDKVPCFHEPAGCCVDDVTNEKFCVEGCLLLRVYKAGYSDALSAERARVIEECAKVAETFHEDDDGIDRQVKRHVAAALRALGQQDTGGADHG